MQVVSYRPKILKQGDYSTYCLSELFSETFNRNFSFQNISSSRVFFIKTEDHGYVFQANIFHDNLTDNVYEHFFPKKYCSLVLE